MTSTIGCRMANPSPSTSRMMVVTVAGSFHGGQRTIAIAYPRLMQTLQSMRRMGCKILSVTDAAVDAAVAEPAQTEVEAPSPVTPIVSQAPQPAEAVESAPAAPAKKTRSSRRRRTSAKTQSTSTAKPKSKRSTRSKRKRTTG